MCTKVNNHPVGYVPKETTLLLPKQNEVPASNSLLMPIPVNSQSSTTNKMIRPSTNNIIFNSIAKMKKNNKPKKTSEILFKKAERTYNRSESSSSKNGGIEAVKPHPQKSVKAMKKSSNKPQQQSLIKPVEGGSLFEHKLNNF